jgi:transcriptional regulator with XRE-family HTH domain
MDKAAVGKRIAEARKQRGLTQQQLAEICGKQREHIARWESGKVIPRFEQLDKLAEALGTSDLSLLFGVEIEKAFAESDRKINSKKFRQAFGFLMGLRHARDIFKKHAVEAALAELDADIGKFTGPHKPENFIAAYKTFGKSQMHPSWDRRSP